MEFNEGIFYPNIFTSEEKAAFRQNPLWALANGLYYDSMDASKGGQQLFLATFAGGDGVTPQARMVSREGYNRLRITQKYARKKRDHSDSQLAFHVEVHHSPVSNTLHDKAIESAKHTYILSRLKNNSTEMGTDYASLRKIDPLVDMTRTMANMFAFNKKQTLDAHSWRATNDSQEYLMRVLFDKMNYADVPEHIKTQIETSYQNHKNRVGMLGSVMEDVTTMFTGEKWLIIRNHITGHFLVGAVDLSRAIKGLDIILRDDRLPADYWEKASLITQPIRMYKSLDALPEEIRKELLPQLTFLKVYREGRGDRDGNLEHGVNLFPTPTQRNTVDIWEDAGAMLHHTGSHWFPSLVVPK